jgi:putative addiction module antidote
MQAIKIRRIGNSLGATLPRQVLQRLNVSEGETVFLTETPQGFALTAYDPTFDAAMQAFERTRKKYRNALRALAK